MFAHWSWAFPIVLQAGSVGRTCPQSAASPKPACVHSTLELPSPCSGLPLEAGSQLYTILVSIPAAEFLALELKFMAACCLEADDEQRAQLYFHIMRWWSWEAVCCSDETTDLTGVLRNRGHLPSLSFNYSEWNSLSDLVTKILQALAACNSRCSFSPCSTRVRAEVRERDGFQGCCLSALLAYMNLTSGWVFVIMELNDSAL